MNRNIENFYQINMPQFKKSLILSIRLEYVH